jgi:hypothetical protein
MIQVNVKQNVHLQATSSTNLLSVTNTIGIPAGIGGALHLLAKLANIHRLPATNTLHFLEELSGGLGSVHISSDIRVIHSALLEDAHAVVVGAHSIMGILKGSGDFLVGVNKEISLEIVSAMFLYWNGMNV